MKLNTKFILYKHYKDIWGSFILRKKYKSRIMRRIMERFENSLRLKWIRKIRKTEMKLKRVKRKSKKRVKNFIFRILFNFYGLQRSFNQKNNALLDFWKRSHILRVKKRLAPKIAWLNYTSFYAMEKRPPFIRAARYFIRKKIDFKHYMLYYCFSSKKTFLKHLKRVEYNYNKNPLQFGISSLLLEILFKTNLFPTTRFCYNFIKMGGLLLNNRIVKNPHSTVRVYDNIKVSPKFLKLTFKIFKLRLKKKKLFFNVPNYIDFDYRLMSFSVWRYPTNIERNLINCFPFLKPKDFDPRPFDIKYNKFKRTIY